jgi:hypothetical protein
VVKKLINNSAVTVEIQNFGFHGPVNLNLLVLNISLESYFKKLARYDSVVISALRRQR